MEAIDEKHMVEKIKEGDAGYFSVLLDRYGSRVFSVIVRIVGSREDAEELTQDVFLKVYQSIGRYRGESSLSTWIYRIAYNHAISGIRKTRKEPPKLGDEILDRYQVEDIESAGGFGDGEEKLMLLERALTFLPTDDAMMIQLFYNEDKSLDELSAITGLTLSNVKVKLHRIRKKLYIYMNEES